LFLSQRRNFGAEDFCTDCKLCWSEEGAMMTKPIPNAISPSIAVMLIRTVRYTSIRIPFAYHIDSLNYPVLHVQAEERDHLERKVGQEDVGVAKAQKQAFFQHFK
jgi:hypothetical protein